MAVQCLRCNFVGRLGVAIVVACFLCVSGNVAFAEPYLQLDATSAVYLTEPEESVYSTDYVFTLYALVNGTAPHAPVLADMESKEYFLSAALTPRVAREPAPNLGSFSLAGEVIQVAADMAYGAPPIEESKKGVISAGVKKN